jgi:hypothetical protein
MKCFRLLLLLPLSVAAQYGPVDLGNAVTADRLYAGFSHLTTVNSSSTLTHITELRTGATLSWQIKPSLALRTFGVLRAISGRQTVSHASTELIWQPAEWLKINAGYTAPLLTELRPNPATAQSQSEFNSQVQIPGAAPGLKLKLMLPAKWQIGLGAAQYGQSTFAQLLIEQGGLRAAISANRQQWLAAAELKTANLQLIAVLSHTHKQAFTAAYNLLPRWLFYTEIESCHWSYATLHAGIRRSFQSTALPLKGFFAAQINTTDSTFGIALFIHL